MMILWLEGLKQKLPKILQVRFSTEWWSNMLSKLEYFFETRGRHMNNFVRIIRHTKGPRVILCTHLVIPQTSSNSKIPLLYEFKLATSNDIVDNTFWGVVYKEVRNGLFLRASWTLKYKFSWLVYWQVCWRVFSDLTHMPVSFLGMLK